MFSEKEFIKVKVLLQVATVINDDSDDKIKITHIDLNIDRSMINSDLNSKHILNYLIHKKIIYEKLIEFDNDKLIITNVLVFKDEDKNEFGLVGIDGLKPSIFSGYDYDFKIYINKISNKIHPV